MGAKGQFKPPAMTLEEAVDKAFDVIVESPGEVALFIIAGRISVTRRDSSSFLTRTERLAGNLIGVYNGAVNARDLREDIATFYREAA